MTAPATRARPSRRAALVWLVSMLLTAGGFAWLGVLLATPGASAAAGGADVYTIAFLALAPVYATVGATIVARGSGNRVGWILAIIGLLLAVENLTGVYAAFAGTPQGRSLPAFVWMDWLSSWVWVPAVVGALGLLPIYFPSGTVPSPRWRPLVWVIWSAGGVALAGFLFSPGQISAGTRTSPNPVGVDGLGSLADLFHALYVLAVLAGAIGGATSLVIRYRRGTADERYQVKWFAGAFGLVALMIAAYAVITTVLRLTTSDWVIGAVICLGLTVIPIAVAIAVLKYRLYDIDVVINRALVYGALATFITAVYVAIVVGIGSLVGAGGQPNLLLSILATAIVAIAFQPVRERVHRVANRLVYGQRATPYEVLSRFSERVAESYAADQVLPRMARVLAEGTGAEHADVWLRSGDALRRAASWPETRAGAAHDPTLAVDGQSLPEVPGADRAVAVRHQGELLGALTVTKRVRESLTPMENKLLDDLAHQAGLVLKNVRLTAELVQRLEDLRASRQRLVVAQDDERRRLERNLHDGAQQNLVALKVKLGLVEMFAARDPARARGLLHEVGADADEALETLRDLARGIYPPLLAGSGLEAALQAQARKATVPVRVDATGIGRYASDTEAAVYFCCLEALQNVQKYATAGQATIRLRAPEGELTFEVEDDGAGFDVAATARGSGLQNMADRLDAMGGALVVRSAPGHGTTLAGRLPVVAPAVEAAAPVTAEVTG